MMGTADGDWPRLPPDAVLNSDIPMNARISEIIGVGDFAQGDRSDYDQDWKDKDSSQIR